MMPWGSGGALLIAVKARIACLLIIFPIPIPIPAYVFGIFYLIYSMYMGKKGQDNIGHNAHFYGALYGLIFTAIVVPNVIRMFITQLFG